MSCFDLCLSTEEMIIQKMCTDSSVCETLNDTRLGLKDYVFTDAYYQRAHLSIIDARERKKLFLLHFTITPRSTSPHPIYGFDIISGPNKVSGAFHDFSPIGPSHLNEWFSTITSELTWNKKRPLPEWARTIFSDSIVAIGAVDEPELKTFIDLGRLTLDQYINELKLDFINLHNHYSLQQRKNDHTLRTLVNLGFTETEARSFVDDRLFPVKD